MALVAQCSFRLEAAAASASSRSRADHMYAEFLESAPDIEALVNAKAAELAQRPPKDAWAALAAIWGRVWVLAGPGWAAWPDARQLVSPVLACALDRAIDHRASPECHAAVDEMEAGADVEDDGSEQWQHVADLIAMLTDAIREEDPLVSITKGLTWHLEGMFNVLANELAAAQGRPISQLEADAEVPGHERWLATVRFVGGL